MAALLTFTLAFGDADESDDLSTLFEFLTLFRHFIPPYLKEKKKNELIPAVPVQGPVREPAPPIPMPQRRRRHGGLYSNHADHWIRDTGGPRSFDGAVPDSGL